MIDFFVDQQLVPTPWADLNDLLDGGLWPGLHLVVGGPGMGKSQFAIQLCYEAAEQHGAAAYYIALEMGGTDFYARLLALADPNGETKWSDLYKGKTPPSPAATAKLKRLPIYLDQGEPHGWSYNRIGEIAKQTRTQHPTGHIVIVVDFLQLAVSPEGTCEDLRERISRAGHAARDAARCYGATIIMLSSVAREHYSRLNGTGDKNKYSNKTNLYTPQTAEALVGIGKESGDLEYTADTVIVMQRERDDALDEVEFNIAVAKQRAGKTGWAHLSFDGSRFYGREHNARHWTVQREEDFDDGTDNPTQKRVERVTTRRRNKTSRPPSR